jgi:putative hydrolase of the HAD superfamily
VTATSKIEGILFDFGGVLVPVYRQDLFHGLEARLGLQPGELSDILWRSPDWRLAEVGAITDAEYWRRIGPWLGLHTAEAVTALQQDLFGEARANPCVVDLVRRLHGRYRTGLLSNASDVINPTFLRERYGLDGLFDVQVISAFVGLAKPDPAIFRLALERLGTVPQATIFVDDYEPNVAAAVTLGIHAIHFEECEALITALRGLGVGA